MLSASLNKIFPSFMEIQDMNCDYISVYTDGSRDGNSVACAAIFSSPDSASVVKEIKNASSSKYIAFTYSLSCLPALQHMKLEHPLIGIVTRK